MAVGSTGAEAVSRGIGRFLAALVFSRSLTLGIVGAAELANKDPERLRTAVELAHEAVERGQRFAVLVAHNH